MHLFFRFAHAHWLYFIFPFFILIILFHRYNKIYPLYQFPLVGYLSARIAKTSQLPVYTFYFLRLAILFSLLILLGKPQLVDQKSKVTVEGIDIMMVLDISGSMTCFDDLKDRRSRISIAKEEALRFIAKRQNDAIGLVVFGNYSMMRCPLTPDKLMLRNMIQSVTMNNGDPIHAGTVISQGVITAARHLQKSKAASKIIILLTDGEPSENDFSPNEAIVIAKSFGIKVYTIGIGNNGMTIQADPFGGYVQYPTHFDTRLLYELAHQTGGKFFDAKKAQDLATIYDEIDMLEKSQYQDDVYMKYYDFFLPLIGFALFLILIEFVLSAFVWTIL